MDLELTREIASAVGESNDVESLSRPLLRILHRLTGLDVTYLTEVDESRDEQRILYSEHFHGVDIPEGLVVNWQDTLCRRALDSGLFFTDDVPNVFSDSKAAADLGLQTYMSVPISDRRNMVIGTLCGASGEQRLVHNDILNVMELFARLVADQWERDRVLLQANERANEAEEKLVKRAMFLAEAEHKLKSPLTVIHGWAMMLDDEGIEVPPDKQQRAIGRIRAASEILATQIDDMIEEARSQIISNSLEFRDFDLSVLFDRVRSELGGVSSKHTVSVESQQPLIVLADEAALWHVLHHLGENAIKYSPDGGEVRMVALQRGSDVVIEVTDSGPGLPDDVDVFEPFVRGDTETAGSGLGLHIAKTLVESLNGTIRVANSTSLGTTFEIVIAAGGNI